MDASHRKQAQLYQVAHPFSQVFLTWRLMIRLHGPDPNISPVCQVSNADGDIEVTMVAEQSPFSQDALQSSMCFILDNGANGHIFVWKGSNQTGSDWD